MCAFLVTCKPSLCTLRNFLRPKLVSSLTSPCKVAVGEGGVGQDCRKREQRGRLQTMKTVMPATGVMLLNVAVAAPVESY